MFNTTNAAALHLKRIISDVRMVDLLLEYRVKAVSTTLPPPDPEVRIWSGQKNMEKWTFNLKTFRGGRSHGKSGCMSVLHSFIWYHPRGEILGMQIAQVCKLEIFVNALTECRTATQNERSHLNTFCLTKTKLSLLIKCRKAASQDKSFFLDQIHRF